MKNRCEITYYPATINNDKSNAAVLTRQDSYFDLLDLTTYEQSRYTFVKPLGAGTYGYVRLFQDENGNKMAVKALKPHKARHLSRQTVDENAKNIGTEFNFLRQAYPDEIGYSLHQFEDPDVAEPELEITESEKNAETKSESDDGSKPNKYIKGNPGIHASYRMTVPFIDGKNLGAFAEDEIVTQTQMAKLMLRLAEELQRIHDVGIIHADIGLRNVMVRHSKSNRDYVIHFIDFGMAYKKNGYATVNFQSHKPTTKSGKKASSTEMAPERFPNRKLKAHPRQDVFSLAKTLNKMIKHRRATWRKNFANQYPFIKSFITTGSDKNPVNRPSLPEFIVKLRNHIDCQETLPADLFNLVLALEADDMSAARKLLEAKSSHYTREKLTPVLYRLIKNQAYDLAEKLMSLRKGIPLDRDVNGDHIFALAAADNEMDNYQFGLMLDYIPKNQLIAVITKENHDGITALRGMVQNQRLSYLIEKLEEQPKLLSEMAAIKISGSTTPESAALHILAQLCKFKNLATDGRRNQLFRGNTAQHKKNIEHAAYYLIEQILSPSNKDDDEFSIHEDIIRETPYLAKLHRDLLINNLIASPQAEESLFGFLPKLFG